MISRLTVHLTVYHKPRILVMFSCLSMCAFFIYVLQSIILYSKRFPYFITSFTFLRYIMCLNTHLQLASRFLFCHVCIAFQRVNNLYVTCASCIAVHDILQRYYYYFLIRVKLKANNFHLLITT